MDSSLFEDAERFVREAGPVAGLERLGQRLEAAKEYHRLFDILSLKARIELGLPPLRRLSGSDCSPEVRTKYEDALEAACRRVGMLWLEAGDYPAAFHYLNMLGDLAPLKEALHRWKPASDEVDEDEFDRMIELCIVHGVHPARGVELVLARRGTCQAITTTEGVLHQEFPAEVKEACVRLLVRALHRELLDRLAAEVEQREKSKPPMANVGMLLQGRDWLFEQEAYHIDTSHLSSVVRMARLLPKGEELFLAIQLCEYGRRLSPRYHYSEPEPFSRIYNDSLLYFRAIAGMETAKAVEHFRRKADELAPEEFGFSPAETLVNLLVRLKRFDEALDFAARRLNEHAGGAGLGCPSVNELCLQAGKLDRLGELARNRRDLTSFAGALAASTAQAKPA